MIIITTHEYLSTGYHLMLLQKGATRYKWCPTTSIIVRMGWSTGHARMHVWTTYNLTCNWQYPVNLGSAQPKASISEYSAKTIICNKSFVSPQSLLQGHEFPLTIRRQVFLHQNSWSIQVFITITIAKTQKNNPNLCIEYP